MNRALYITVNGEPQFQVEPPPAEHEQSPEGGTDIPEKFKNEDGSLNTEALLKSNHELQKQFTQSRQKTAEGENAPEGEQIDFASLDDEQLNE